MQYVLSAFIFKSYSVYFTVYSGKSFHCFIFIKLQKDFSAHTDQPRKKVIHNNLHSFVKSEEQIN